MLDRLGAHFEFLWWIQTQALRSKIFSPRSSAQPRHGSYDQRFSLFAAFGEMPGSEQRHALVELLLVGLRAVPGMEKNNVKEFRMSWMSFLLKQSFGFRIVFHRSAIYIHAWMNVQAYCTIYITCITCVHTCILVAAFPEVCGRDDHEYPLSGLYSGGNLRPETSPGRAEICWRSWIVIAQSQGS